MEEVPKHNTKFIDAIWDTIWARVPFEDEMPPSSGALKLQWLRSLWVLHLWSQANTNSVVIKDIGISGGEIYSSGLKVVWETPAHISLLTRGCGCKTGFRTKRCQCAKKGQYCGPGCKCSQCSNVKSGSSMSESEDELLLEEEAEEIRARSNLERTLMTTEDEEHSILSVCEDSNTEHLSSRHVDECTADGADSDSSTL